MTEKLKAGRPRKAAQSVQEAVHMVVTGTAPKRGRNALERAVMSKGRNGKRGGGRPTNPQAPTQQAAQLAAYLVTADGLKLTEAVRIASANYGADRSNVRKYAAKLLKPPTVSITRKLEQVGAVFPGVSLLVTEGEITAELPFVAEALSITPTKVASAVAALTNKPTSSYPR